MRLALLRRTFLTPDSAENLALLRITTGLLLLTSSELYASRHVAALPPLLRTRPESLSPLLGLLPVSVPLVDVAVILCATASLFGAIGFLARPAFLIAAVAGFYALGVGQLGGAVWHCHHLLWFALLLAASPASDALSIDALLRQRRSGPGVPAPAICYGLPLRIAWALLATILFFPGMWKLRASGLAWIFSDNLRNQMHWKWLQMGGYLPLLRIDRSPLLCQLGAGAVVLCELLFPLLIWSRRSRPLAVLSALLFHGLAWLYLGINFSNLWPLYIVFFDGSRLLHRLRKADDSAPPVLASHSPLPTVIIGALLLFGSVRAGWRGQISGWPFACYPTFQWRAGATMPVLLVKLVQADGGLVEVPRPWHLGPIAGGRLVALSWSLIGVGLDGRAADPERLRSYWLKLGAEPQVTALLRARRGELTAVRFYRATLAVDPDAWSLPPVAQTLLAEMPLN